MNDKTNTIIIKARPVIPIFWGILIGVLGTITVTNLYWFVFMRLYSQDSVENSFIPHNRLLILFLFHFGAFILPLIGAIIGGYFTSKFSQAAGIIKSIFVGLAGVLLCFGYILIYGPNAEYPQVYIILGFLWIPASILGAIIYKIIKKT